MGSEGTYGTAALLFGAADFEIGKAWHAGVFLEFCVGVDEHGKRLICGFGHLLVLRGTVGFLISGEWGVFRRV